MKRKLFCVIFLYIISSLILFFIIDTRFNSLPNSELGYKLLLPVIFTFTSILFYTIGLLRKMKSNRTSNFRNYFTYSIFLIFFSLFGIGGVVGGGMAISELMQEDSFRPLFLVFANFFTAFVFIYTMFVFPYKRPISHDSAQTIAC